MLWRFSDKTTIHPLLQPIVIESLQAADTPNSASYDGTMSRANSASRTRGPRSAWLGSVACEVYLAIGR